MRSLGSTELLWLRGPQETRVFPRRPKHVKLANLGMGMGNSGQVVLGMEILP